MNDSEQFDSDFASPNENMADVQQEGLRKLFLATLVAVLILAGSMNIFLIRQMVFMRKDLEAVRPQVKLIMETYQKVEEPQIKGFINALVTFSRTHPDFSPVLAKYKIVPEVQQTTAPTGVPTTPTRKK